MCRKLAVAGYVDAVKLDLAVFGVAKGLTVDTDAYGRHFGGGSRMLYRSSSCVTVYLHVAAFCMRM